MFFSRCRRRLLVYSGDVIASLQLLVDPEDAGASLPLLADQEATEVLPVELLKPHTGSGTHERRTYSKIKSLQENVS